MRKKIEMVNMYFKDAGTRPFVPLLSGLALHLDDDGVCRDYRFVRCDFHPVCESVRFENCEFVECTGDEFLKKG